MLFILFLAAVLACMLVFVRDSLSLHLCLFVEYLASGESGQQDMQAISLSLSCEHKLASHFRPVLRLLLLSFLYSVVTHQIGGLVVFLKQILPHVVIE